MAVNARAIFAASMVYFAIANPDLFDHIVKNFVKKAEKSKKAKKAKK